MYILFLDNGIIHLKTMEGASGSGHVISEKGDAVDTIDEMRKKRLAYFTSAQKTAEKEPHSIQDSQKIGNNSLRTSDSVKVNVDRNLSKTNDLLFAQSLDQNVRTQNVGSILNQEPSVVESSAGIHCSGSLSFATKSCNVNERTCAAQNDSQFTQSQHPPKLDWKKHVEGLFQRDQEIDPALRDSFDVEAMSLFKSEADLDSLGLSTHRPESTVMDSHGDATLDRDITQEIKHLLGPKKYQDFVDKSIKDINELYQHKTTETSPHLMNSLTEEHKQDSGNEVARSKQRMKEIKEKLPSQDIRKLENEVPLNNSFAKTSSQRPRLNRPRKEPMHIQNIVKKNLKDLENAATVSSGVRNYDQVTVPHNVTYSTDEIYRQAFAMAHSQVPPPGYHGSGVGGMSSPEVRPIVSSSQLFQSNIGSPPPGGMPFFYPGQAPSLQNQRPPPPPHSVFCPPYQHSDYNQTVMNSAAYSYQMSEYEGRYPRAPFTNGGNYPAPVFYPGAIDFSQPPPGWGMFNPPQMDHIPHPPVEKKPGGEVNKATSRPVAWSAQGNVFNGVVDAELVQNEEDMLHKSIDHPEESQTQQENVLDVADDPMMQPSQRHIEKIRQHHEQR